MSEIDWENGEITAPEGATTESADWESGKITPPVADKGFLGHAKDLGLSAVKSAIAVPETAVGLGDIITGGKTGQAAERLGFRPKDAKSFVSEFHTDKYKEQQQDFQNADGVIDKLGVAVENPSLIGNAVTESIAPMLAGGVAGRAVKAVAPAASSVAAASIGEGAVMAGSQAEAIRQETDDGLLTPGQTLAAAGTGALGSVFGYAGGRLAAKLGIGDADTLLTRGITPEQVAADLASAPAKSIPRKVIEGAITEGFLEELPQSVSEQIIQNLALDKPWSDGVDDAIVMGTLSGMAMGGTAASFGGPSQQPEADPLAGSAPQPGAIPPEAPAQEPAPQAAGPLPPLSPVAEILPGAAPAPVAPSQSQQMGIDPNAGPMSSAAALAVDSGASEQLAQQSALQQAAELAQKGGNASGNGSVDPDTGEVMQGQPQPDRAAELQERIDYVQKQAKVSGWDQRLMEERESALAELAALQPQEKAVEAASQALAAGGNEADASRAATDSLIGDMEKSPGISIASDAPAAVAAAVEKAKAPAAAPGAQDPRFGLEPPKSVKEGIEQARKKKAAEKQPAATVDPAAATAAQPQANPADIKAITAKQIPDMTDAELQLAADHYGPDHKRTAKLSKEIARRGVATQNPQLEIQADAQQATETEQASPQRAQAPGAPAEAAAEAAAGANGAVDGRASAELDTAIRNGTFDGPAGLTSLRENSAKRVIELEAKAASASVDTQKAADAALERERKNLSAIEQDIAKYSQAQPASSAKADFSKLTSEGRAKVVADAAARWMRSTETERAGYVERINAKPVLKANLPRADFDSLHSGLQRDIAEQMGLIPSAQAEAPAAESGKEDAITANHKKAVEQKRRLTPPTREQVAEAESIGLVDADKYRTIGALEDGMGMQRKRNSQSIEGKDIDGNWSEFSKESGTQGVPRAEMPQIKAEHRGAMVNFLNARGIEHQEDTVPSASLKPTQAEFSREKVAKAKAYQGGNRSILVSGDGHVLDGHHQWMAARENGEDVKVIRLNAPITDLLTAAREFPSSTTDAGGEQEATYSRRIVRTYTTQSGKVGAEVRESRNSDGKITYSHAGEWGAGSGQSEKDMIAIENNWKSSKRGFTVSTPDGAPKSTSAAVRSIRAKKALADALAPLNFTNNQGNGVNTTSAEGFGRRTSTSVRVIVDGEKIQYQVNDTREQADGGRMKAYGPATQDVFDTQDDAVATAEKYKAANQVWVRRDDRPKPGDTDYSLAMAREDLSIMQGQPGSGGMVTDSRLAERIARQEKLIDEMQAAEFAPSAEQRQAAKQAGLDQASKISTWKVKPSAQAQVKAAILDSLASSLPGAHLDSARALGDEIYSEILATPDAATAEPAVTDDDIDNMFDTVLAELAPKAEQEAAPAEEASPAEVESLEDELRAQKKRVMRLKGGDATKLKAAEARLRRMRTGIFEAEDKLVPAARAGDEKALQQLEEMGYADTADAVRAFLPTPERSAGKALGSAVKNAGSALDEAINGLGALFGGGGKLSSGLTFDEDTYAKAKPMFISAAANVKAATKDLADVMRAVVGMVIDRFGVETAQNMKPYVSRFVKEVRDGKVNLESSNERTAIRDDGQEALGDVATQEGGAVEGGRRPGVDAADSGQAGDGASAGADATGVPATRSGGSGKGGADSAKAGKRSKSGAVGRGGKRQPGTAVSENDGLTVEVNGEQVSHSNVPAANFAITADTQLGKGGEVQKFNDNLAAIRVVKQLDRDNRRATPEEQALLARYVGWGGLASAFPDPSSGKFKDKWADRGTELRDLLTPEEYAAARQSTRNAHYTSETVVSAIWKAVTRLGFKGGMVLESSMGTGNFLGLAPQNIPARFVGVEYDGLTARIASALYPQATVLHSGFHKVPMADNAFALNIGNPPFGSESLRFQFKPELAGKSIHNQFFLAGMDALRPGGIQSMVVSRYLLDAQDKSTRLALARQAKLVGAIRLPDTAFKENARTEVVTDIIFLQKLTPSEQIAASAAVDAYMQKSATNPGLEKERRELAARVPAWVESKKVPDPLGGEDMNVNGYFAEHPEHIMGVLERSGSMQHGNDITVRLDNPAELESRLDAAIATLPENIQQLDHDVLAATEARFKSMSDALRIAVGNEEVGHLKIDQDGKLQRVIERETPEGDYEYSRQEITPESPWSDQLSQDANGNWYRLEVQVGEDGKNLKVLNADGKPTNRNVYSRTTFASEADVPDSLLLGKTSYARLTGLVKLRDLLKRQLVLETSDAAKGVMEGNRKALAAAYDAFVAEHGPVNRPVNLRLAMTMPDGGLTAAVEVGYQPARSAAQAARSGLEVQDEKATPAPILRGRVVPKYEPASKASTPSDALAITLAETGRVNIDRIADLLSITPEEAASQLQAGSDPLVFQDPETQQWETADAYLSGMVKRKLEAAKAAGMAANVEALEKIIPEDWTAENVAVQLGSTWVPSQYYADYLEQLSGGKARVSFSGLTNAFSVNLTNEGPQASEWSTEGAPVSYIVGRLLNSQPVVVTYTDFEGVTRVDREKTALAGLKAREIASDFGDWIFRDGERRNDLVKLFNEQFNTRVVRQFNGQHLQLPGKVPDSIIKMRRHQLNAIWRGIYERFMLMDHTVGAGKTFTAIARAMERRRMGLSQKPMIVVPNHLVEQWEADVYRLYPGAKVLAAGKKDFEAKNRRRLFGKIATGDWDIVIVPHSSFGFIGIAPDTEARFLQAELASAQEAIEAAWEQAEEDGNATGRRKPFGVKEAERLLTTLQNRMDAISAGAKDRQLTFEQLGIDDLTVDEAHEFKNLAYSSRLTGVRGMGDKSGSRKANDLYNKVRVLTESPTSTVTFLTGTPISNSAVEMFTVLRYLAAQSLEEMGMTHFDAFRAQFVEATAAFEPTESGRLKEVTRLGRTWSNMRSLMDLYYQVTDAVSLDDIKQWYAEDNGGADFPVPKVKGGKDRELVAIKPTAAQETMLQVIMDGFDGLDGIQDPDERNAERLRLMDRARKLSLDVRAVDPTSTSKEKGGKLEVAADNIKRIYDQWDAENGTQLVFLDRSVPKAKGDDKVIKAYDELLEKRDAAIAKNDEKALEEITEELDKYDAQEITELRAAQNDGWNGYQQLKDNLIAQGIPANEIRFIQEANNDEQKAAMFDAVRGGKVRVLIGSTPRMGAGTNVQDRIVALHHIDVTWKPSDIEQREGRAIRQGNLFATPGSELFREGFEVEIMAYATERTVDAKMWDLNATKLRTINGIRKYDGAFSMEFEDAEAVGMAEMAALASGNPLLLERVKLDSQIGSLELQERAFRRKMYAIKDQLDTARKNLERNPSLIERATQRQADAQQSIDKAARAKLARTVTIEGEVFNTLSEASRAVEDAVKLQQDGNEKARYAVNIDGKRVTSKDGIVEAIGSALGDSAPFEATINGNATGQRTVAARAIAEQLNALGAGDQSVTLGEVFGYTLSADVTYYKQLGTDFKEVSLTLEKDGATFVSASSREVAADDAFVPANVRSPLDRLVERLSAIATTDEAGHLRRQISSAKRDIPDLEARVGNGFTGADELNEKRKRLAEVVSELEGKAPALAEAAAATDYASTAIPATSQAAGGRMPPIDSRVAFSFAGRAAQGADLMALATAKERIAAGWGAEAVRKDTGWSRGADGKWRFEISDDQASLAVKGDTAQAVLNNARLNAVEAGRSELVASDVLDHPQLFAAYPELADVPISLTPAGVTAQARLRYVKGKPHIMVKGTMPASRLPSSLLHELQHAIQRKEGYATGGSKDSLMSDLDPTGVNTYRRLAGEVEARNTQTRQRMTPAMRREIAPQESADTAADQVIITFNGKDMTDLAAPKNAGRPALSEKALVRAFNLQFPKLSPAVSKMLARGKKGEKGGVVILSDADPLAIAGAFSRKTGRPLSESVQMFGDAGKVNGFYDPRSGLTFLVGPNLDPVTGPAVLLHEMTHGQQKQKIDQRAADMLMNRGKVKSADLRTFLDRVANRMIDAGETANAQEAAAYIVEQAVIEGRSQGYALADSRFLGWVDSALGKQVGDFLRSVLANIRQFMLRNGMPIGEVTVDDLVQYAMVGVEQAANGNVNGGELAFSRDSQINSPAFKRWFGDSKVVDAEGKPLVVYHGTKADISQFDGNRATEKDAGWYGRGIYFTADPATASAYSGFEEMQGKAPREGANVMPVYVSLQNPYVWPKGRAVATSREEAGAIRAELEAAGHDGVVVPNGYADPEYSRHYEVIVFEPTQIKSAIGNNGDFDPSNPDIRFSRSGVRDLANKATAEFNRTFSAPGKLSAWHKTVGTMYNLAERSPEFKPVFKHAQGFIDDVAHYAADASEHAPTLLPRLETWKDITKSAIKAEDNKAIAKPIFEGTLLWGRDENGKAVLVDTLANAASMLSTERKAEILLAQGKVPEGILKAWRGTGEARFKQMIDSRYETHMLKPGVIWSDAELTSLFNLTAPQIAMYREFREATDRSLDTMTRAQMIRLAGKDAKEIREAVMDAPDAREGAKIIRNHLGQLASLNPDRETQLLAMAQSVQQALEQMQKVQGEGYAPLMRFGKFTVYVQSPSGESVYFGMFETAREANAMAASMRELYPNDIVSQGTKGEDMFKMFAGVNPETAELFGKFMDLDSTGDDARDKAFQEWLRITKNNRSAMKRLIHRKGISGYNEDVGRVLASFVYSNSRNTSAGLNMGDLSEAVAAIPKEQGELQDVAVALAEYIKNPQEEAQAVRGLLFAQYLGGSVASAFVNMTQPFAVSFPWLSQHGGVGKAAKALGLAAKHMSTRGYKYEADLAEALKKAEDDGIVSPQEVHQLMAQARGSGSLRAGDGTRIGDARALASNSVARMSVAWGKLFGSAEQVNRRITYIAAYRMAKAQGMASADEFARHAVKETQFVYSKASKMKWGRGAVGGTLMTFKTYSIAYVELMHRLWNQGEPGTQERADGRKAAALMIAVLLLMGGAGGLPFAEDAEDLIDGAGQLMGYNLSSKKAKEQFLIDVFGDTLGGFIDKGLTGIPGSPVDVSGRLGMGNLIPGTGLFLDRADSSRDIMELAGPAGDFAKRIFTGGKELLKGNVGKAVLEVSPTAVRNAAKGVDMAATGMYRDTKGYKVLDATLLESALKGIGFQPGGVAKIQEANYINQRSKAFYSQQAQNIRAQWAAGIFEGDPSKVQAARDALAAWNAKNPEQRIIIRIPDVMRRVREMSLSKDERIAKTAPKAMRAQMMEGAARIRGQLAD